MPICAACGQNVVTFAGRSNSKFLLVEEQPLVVYRDNPMDRNISPRKILSKEFAKAGLELAEWRIVPVWMHTPTENENCWNEGVDNVINEAKGKDVILLMGSSVCEQFTGYKVSKVVGLELDSESFPDAKIVIAIPSIKSAYAKGIGEIKIALQKLSKKMENL